jgi:hypothetical protein
MNNGKNLIEAYHKLELEVEQNLIQLIEKFGKDSKHREGKALSVNIFGYTELMNDYGLFFLGPDGLHYSLYEDCTLVDLIDMINQYDDGN